jgi:hypothetical protein
MKPQISKKVLVQLSLGSTVVVLAAILLYLGFSGRSAPARPGMSSTAAGRTVPPAVVPQTAPRMPAGRPAAGTPSAPPLRGTQVAQTPPGSQPPAGAGQPAPATKPGTGPSPAPGSPVGAEPAAPAPAAAPAKPQDPEAAVVGTGQRGRSDPFSPLVNPEAPRAAPTLPPPPGVGLPMPPGFAAPGAGPGVGAPPSPGAGMKVTGIMGSRNRVAIIEVDGQTHIVGVGERVGDAVVVSIMPEKVIMKQHNVTFELGIGGDRSS